MLLFKTFYICEVRATKSSLTRNHRTLSKPTVWLRLIEYLEACAGPKDHVGEFYPGDLQNCRYSSPSFLNSLSQDQIEINIYCTYSLTYIVNKLLRLLSIRIKN